ncbi:hypothetical protein J6590_043452 [Homalodisca vitripennis]|nr:hypothetical protein J6590_043452 [Homalodisca vitripennis]
MNSVETFIAVLETCKREHPNPLFSPILHVLMGYWPAQGLLQTAYKEESVQYKINGTDKKSNGHRQYLNPCLIYNSDPQSDVLDYNLTDYRPMRLVIMNVRE